MPRNRAYKPIYKLVRFLYSAVHSLNLAALRIVAFLQLPARAFSATCTWVVRGLGGVVVIHAAIGAYGRGSRLAHYFTVAATLDKSLSSHCL